MQRFLIKGVNCALLILIIIGLPAATHDKLGNLRITSASVSQLVMFWGLSLALGANIFSAMFLVKGKKERRLCWEWAVAFGVLLFTYSALVFGYFNFDWLKRSLLWLQSHL
ncbi:MAG TPA: hypothetical protein VGI03_06840 [Verrucomicrobiae bacterium]|jgi:hypothetical protein